MHLELLCVLGSLCPRLKTLKSLLEHVPRDGLTEFVISIIPEVTPTCQRNTVIILYLGDASNEGGE